MPLAHPRFHLAPLALAITLALAGPGVTLAQSAASGPSAISLSIAAQPLANALNELSAATGTAIGFAPALVAGKTAPAVHGTLTAQQALEQMLAGSGLVAQPQGGGLVIKAKAGETVTLSAVTVLGAVDAATEGSGSYTSMGPSPTATKLGLSVRETPQSVSVITRQQMDDQGLTNVPEVLEKTTGVTVGRNDTERFTFYARGFSIENFQFDGVPNTAMSAIAFTTALGDSAIYDRVEVVRGATGLLSGAGNPSAVVNLVRKRPTRDFTASLEAGLGSWSRRRGVADVSGPLNESGSVRGRVVAAAQNANSFIDYYSRNTRNVYAIVEADITPDTLVGVGLDYMKTQADGASFGHIPLFYSDGSRTDFSRSWNPAARWSYWDNSSRNLFATLKQELGGGWKLDASASHLAQWRDVLYGTAYNGTVDKETGAGIRMLSGTIPVQAKTNSFNTTLTGPYELFGRTHELVVSAGYSRQSRTAQNVTSVWTTIPDYFAWNGHIAQPSFKRNTDRHTVVEEKGLSLATRLKPTDQLSVILGARASWYELLDINTVLATGNRNVSDDLNIKHKITPYAGLVYDINDQWSAYASVTDIFQPQTYYKDANDQPLKPLTGRSHEIGVKAELLDRKLNASLALFHVRQNNTPQYVGINGEGEVYQAVEGVTSKGVEAELSGSLTPAWNVFGGYTYRTSKAPAQPDQVSNEVNTNQPRHLLKLGTSYRLPGQWSQWTVGGNATWQSKTFYQQASSPYWRAYQPAYAVVGLMAQYRFSPALTATLNLNNVFDKTYMPGLGSYGTGVYGDPRNVLLTMKYAF